MKISDLVFYFSKVIEHLYCYSIKYHLILDYMAMCLDTVPIAMGIENILQRRSVESCGEDILLW